MLATGFCDLCINVGDGDKEKLRDLLRKSCDLGYQTVALNQNVDESIFESEKTKKKKKAGENDQTSQVPEPIDVQDLIAEFNGKLRILSRLTFSFSDTAKTYRLGHSVTLKKYNLYAVVPKSQTALQFACSQLNVDVIYINSSCTGLRFNRKLYLQASKRGVYFEIQYGDVINSETRKFALYWSHLFHTYGRSRNVVVSSGAENSFHLRNPYDVILLVLNRGPIFGLSGQQSQASILLQCHNLCYKAEKRPLGKSTFTVHASPANRDIYASKKIKL